MIRAHRPVPAAAGCRGPAGRQAPGARL